MIDFIKKQFRQLLIGAIFLMTYVPTFVWMWGRWFARDSYYSHGILIPFVTGYLIWQHRKELASIKQDSSRWGIPLIILGIIIHVLSSLMRVYFTSGFSMIIVFIGLILYFYGAQMLKKLSFPALFLIFMIPVPLVVVSNISFKMKILASEIATVALNNMGLLALREGSLIRMQHAYVIVDDVCSGLRSLIALMALGSIFAYWVKVSMPRRIILFASTMPIAIATNVARIIFLSSIAEIWGVEYTMGFLHSASGFMVFALAFVMLFAVGRLVE